MEHDFIIISSHGKFGAFNNVNNIMNFINDSMRAVKNILDSHMLVTSKFYMGAQDYHDMMSWFK